ncbi:MAG: hypothetical protein JXB05_20430 [Myxococcaceae bacterium]|nr:hypothetical protein [Myxococcaceae bacterium]
MKRLIAGLAVAASMMLAMAPTSASAAVQQVIEIYYYDSTYTVQLGFKIIYCDGSMYSEGQATRYQERYYTDWCPGSALTGGRPSTTEAALHSSPVSIAR